MKRWYKTGKEAKRQRQILLFACAIAYLDGKMTREQCDARQGRIWRAWQNVNRL